MNANANTIEINGRIWSISAEFTREDHLTNGLHNLYTDMVARQIVAELWLQKSGKGSTVDYLAFRFEDGTTDTPTRIGRV